jgi:hypothetical protein
MSEVIPVLPDEVIVKVRQVTSEVYLFYLMTSLWLQKS